MPVQFVLSVAGRDMGRVAITVGVADDGRVLIADGRTHRLKNPKKKSNLLLFLRHSEKNSNGSYSVLDLNFL